MNPAPQRRLLHSVQVVWLLMVCLAARGVAIADYKDDTGYTLLKLELGAAMPTGAGVTVSQIEASSGSAYAPDSSNGEFSGKTITLKSGASSASGHATTVALHFFGSTTSLSPGVSIIDSYEANNWIGSGMLKTGGGNPNTETRDVANFSWIGTTNDGATDQEIIRRFDYSIQTSNYVAVVGTNNGDSTAVPALLAHNYNGITVGKSDGDHASGLTSFDNAGRGKPDLVAPPSPGNNFTSFTTPLVASAAVDLIQVARSTSGLGNGADSRAIKALLLAGATRSEFPTWTRTSSAPLDSTYGAGELNIYNSYHILTAGEQGPGSVITVGTSGWDLGAVSTTNLLYFFDVPAGFSLSNFSAALIWNRIITDTEPSPNAFATTAFLDSLDMKLFRATDFTVGALVDSSASSVDNVEFIAQESLPAGRYVIEIDHGTSNTTYALAWNGIVTVVPEPSTAALLLCAFGIVGARRLRPIRRS